MEAVELLDGAAEAIAALNAAELPVAVVTNQAGVARGFYGIEDVRAVHAHIDDLLAREGAHVDAWLFCPYHPSGIVEEYSRWSSDRKPAPGMALAAAHRLGLDLGRSWVVGDSECDVELARGVGARPIRIGDVDDETQVTTVPSLAAAVSHVLADVGSRESWTAQVLTFPQMRYDSAYLFAEHYSHELAQALATVDVAAFDRASKVLGDAYDRDAAVFVCGNGGSASIANHLQCDHIKGVRVGTDLHTRVTSLSTNVEILSAIANDIGYEAVFEYQLESMARPGDVLVAVSSSGSSPNVVRALRWAEEHGLQTIAMSGFGVGTPARSPASRSMSTHATTGSSRTRTRPACTCSPSTSVSRGWRPMSWRRRSSDGTRVAVNLLTDDPHNPSGAHWFWTRVIPEMAVRMRDDEELRLLVSPRLRSMHDGYPGPVSRLMFPWSNEHPRLRALSEQLIAPVWLPLDGVDVFSTLIAPAVKPAPAVVAHFKTMHAFTTPEAIRPLVRWYRRKGYPHTAEVADAIIINSESLRAEVDRYLDVDPAKLHLIPEAVDHDLFRPGDPVEAGARISQRYGVRGPFVLFVSSLWPYKNCDGLLRAFARAGLPDHRLVVVGPGRDLAYVAELRALAGRLGIEDRIDWIGGIPIEETVPFYRAASVFAYPSHNETFGLPILEAMATGCPVVTSDRSAMPETAGGAALLADPDDPESIASALEDACGSEATLMRKLGLERAQDFTWAATAQRTLEVYRQVHAHRKERS